MPGLVMVTVALIVRVESAVDFAVIVTVLDDGTEAGAVNVVPIPLAVCRGLSVPQLGLPQVSAQSTPEFEPSFETTAITVAEVEVCTVEGGAWLKAMETGAVIVTAAEAVLVGSVTEVAVTVTGLTAGSEAGAV